MEINVFPEKLIMKMWESLVDNGIGSLLKPWQIKREGRARLEVRKEELLVLAQTQNEAKLIQNGCKQFSNYRLQSVKNDMADTNTTNPNINFLIDKFDHKMKYDAIISEININKAIIHAETAITNDTDMMSSDQDSKTVNKDWLNLWQEYVKNVSSEDMQQLWGKILAGEVRNPGKYSLRTLQFVQHLSQNEAEEISQLAQYNIDGRVIKDVVIDTQQKTFDYFLRMEEFGIIQGVSSLGLNATYVSNNLVNYNKALIYGKALIVISDFDAHKKLVLQALPLTSLGKELLSLCIGEPNEIYINEVIKLIKKQGFKVSTTQQWIYTNSGRNIKYFNLKEMGENG